MAVEHEGGEEYTKSEVDPTTGVVEKVDKQKAARKLSENPEDWREQK